MFIEVYQVFLLGVGINFWFFKDMS